MNVTSRQVILLISIGIVGIFLVYQVKILSGGNGKSPTPNTVTINTKPAPNLAASAVESAPSTQAAIKTATPEITSEESQYLSLVRQYEATKLKREIAKNEEAEWAAERNVEKARSEISELKTSHGTESVVAKNDSEQTAPYQLMYVRERQGNWEALLRDRGKVATVQVGSVLSNGAQVQAITEKGIVLKTASGVQKINFTGED